MIKRFHILLLLLSLTYNWTGLLSQNQSGFYDEFDLNLRNVPEGPGEDRYRIYQVPAKKNNNSPVTPKRVIRFFDPLAGFPGAGTGNLEQLGNQGSNKTQPLGQNNTNFINPITGEVNYDSLQNSINNRDRERERKEKDKKRFIEEQTFKESKFRRFQIIFFLTIPAAFGASAGVAGALGIVREISGSIMIIAGTLGLSGANAYQDLKNMEKHKMEHGTEWHSDDEDIAANP